MTITACEQGQVAVGDRCAVTTRRFRLLCLIGPDETRAALGRLQPTGLSLLLAGEAREIVDLLVTTGARDDLSYAALMLDGRFQATSMSQGESGMR